MLANATAREAANVKVEVNHSDQKVHDELEFKMCNAAKTDMKNDKKRKAAVAKNETVVAKNETAVATNGKKSKFAPIFILAAAKEIEDEQTEDDEYDSE